MSKIEVNQISSQCGSTLTVGQSGDTVTLASGASQTGFGRTGTVDWDTTPKTATFSAVSGEGYFCNTTSSAFTVNLPAGSAGAIVSLADYAATWQTNNLTVSPNGTDKIGGINEDAILNTEGQSVTFVYVDSTQGWINTMDSTSNVRASEFVIATGGTITCCGDFKIHTFTGPGTFTVTNAGTPAGSTTVDYLVVAGGGGGGAGHPSSGAAGSGAGAGGYRESSGTSSGCYTVSPLGACVSALPVSVQGYPIVVGGGGAGACSLAPAPGPTKASCGSNSSFSTITSTAGGYGGSRSWGSIPNGGSGTNTNCRSDGGPGGSGGGGNIFCAPNPGTSGTIGTGNTPPVSPPQGQNGGVYSPGTNGGVSGGGATGAGATNNPGPSSAAGGAGATSSINGTPTGRAGGGGGGLSASGAGGGTASDGGGAGGPTPGGTGSNGTANTGGGAGGGGSAGDGGAGGSGIVIIRYKFQ